MLRISWESTEIFLRICWKSAKNLLRICWKSAENLLRICWESVKNLLRICKESAKNLLRIFWKSAENLLRIFWESTQNLLRIFSEYVKHFLMSIYYKSNWKCFNCWEYINHLQVIYQKVSEKIQYFGKWNWIYIICISKKYVNCYPQGTDVQLKVFYFVNFCKILQNWSYFDSASN